MKKEDFRKAFNPMQYVSKKRNRFIIIVISVMAVAALLYLFGSPKVYERALPKLVKGHILLKEEEEKTAVDKPRTATLKENILMYAVIEGQEVFSSKHKYFSQTDSIMLDGKIVPVDSVEKWDRFWKDLKIGWIKIEPLYLKLDGRGKTDLSFIKYKYRWRFDGLYYWILPADAKPTGLIEYEVEQVKSQRRKTFSDPKKYPGTMFFRYYAYIHSDSDSINPIREVATPGVETAGPNGLGENVMRVTFVEDKSFKGFCTGYFNVPYIEGNEELVSKTCASERYIGVSNRSYIYESALQAGYDIKEKSVSGLRNACTVVFSNLYLSSSGNIYPFGKEGFNIRFSNDGVKPGDIIVWGREKNMAVLYSDGGLEAMPDNTFNGTDVVIAAGKTGVDKDYFANVVDDKFEIWRLTKKKADINEK